MSFECALLMESLQETCTGFEREAAIAVNWKDRQSQTEKCSAAEGIIEI